MNWGMFNQGLCCEQAGPTCDDVLLLAWRFAHTREAHVAFEDITIPAGQSWILTKSPNASPPFFLGCGTPEASNALVCQHRGSSVVTSVALDFGCVGRNPDRWGMTLWLWQHPSLSLTGHWYHRYGGGPFPNGELFQVEHTAALKFEHDDPFIGGGPFSHGPNARARVVLVPEP